MTLRTQKLSASNAVVYAPRPVVEVVGRVVSEEREGDGYRGTECAVTERGEIEGGGREGQRAGGSGVSSDGAVSKEWADLMMGAAVVVATDLD